MHLGQVVGVPVAIAVGEYEHAPLAGVPRVDLPARPDRDRLNRPEGRPPGGLLGVGTGLGIAGLLRAVVPGLPIETPLGYVLLALGVSLTVGLLSGVLPARRAARLDPCATLQEV